MSHRPYQAKFKLSPDGRGSLFRVFAPSKSEALGSSLKLQQGLKVDENGEVTGAVDFYCERPTPLPAGKGGLGNKSKMSTHTKGALKGRLAAMELEFGLENCIFPTLTLPSIDIAAYEGLARYSAYVANRLSMVIDRYFDNEIFGEMARAFIWEYQERGALHLHIAIACRCMDAISINDFERWLRLKWIEILESVSEIYCCNCFIKSDGREWNIWELLEGYYDKKGKLNNAIPKALCKVEFVSKSIVAYLSGYLSGSNHDDSLDAKQFLREKFYPIATWAQWNRKTTQYFNKWNIEMDFGFIEPDNLEAFDDCCEILEKCIPMAEGTVPYPPLNPYVEGFSFVSDRLGFPVEMIREFREEMRQAGILKGRLHYMKDKYEIGLNRDYRNGKLDLETYKYLYNYLDIERFKRREKMRVVGWFKKIFGLFDLIEKTANIVKVQYPLYEQLEINYESQNQRILPV